MTLQKQDYWIPAEGIDREVIVHEIATYLGQDTLVRPGKNDDGQPGYVITAFRSPTTFIIDSLKETSATRSPSDFLGLPKPANFRREQPNRDYSQVSPTGTGRSAYESDDSDDEPSPPYKLGEFADISDGRALAGDRERMERPHPQLFRQALLRPRSEAEYSQNAERLDRPPISGVSRLARSSALPSVGPVNTVRGYQPNAIMQGMDHTTQSPGFPALIPNTKAHSDSGETYKTSLSTSANLRTRLRSVCCEGPHSGHTIDAFLDSGATDNVISQKLYTILETMEAVELEDPDDEISEIGSPVGEVIEVIGVTKINIRWFDHEGENVRRKIKFKVIPGLYPDMIFKPTTFRELGMLLAADTWPRDDPRKGFLMFNMPWLSSKTKEQNRKGHEIKKAANAARAAQEREDRKNQRSVVVPANTAIPSQRKNRPQDP